MIKRSLSAFSLLELLIAIALSAVIMMGLAQANRNAARLLRQAQNLLVVNRQAALFFNQLERDITAAVAYQKAEPYTPEKKEKKGAEAPPAVEDKSDQRAKKGKEAFVPSCMLEAAEEGVYKVGTKKWQMLKSVSFITTTPLDVYEQEQVCLVRVQYQLRANKKMSTKQKAVYLLERVQTDELENVQCKEADDEKNKRVTRCIVADAVKQFSLEAAYELKPAKKKEGEAAAPPAPEQELSKTFTWGEKEEREKSKTRLPDHFSAHIEFWDTELDQSYTFTALLPVFVKDAVVEGKKETEKEAPDKEQAPTKAAEKGDAS